MNLLPSLDLEAMRSVDIRTIDPSTLINIRDVTIDATQPFVEKAVDYLNQIGNVYCFKCDDVIVKVKYSQTTISINDCMETFYRSL